MTVCIAAICKDDDESKIVLCTDRRAGGALGSSETALKERALSSKFGWRCLTAGTEPDIRALLRIYQSKFNYKENITFNNIDSTIKSGLFQRKKDLSNEYIQNRFAISYDEFLQFGKDKLSPDLYHDALQRISSIDLKSEFIIAGFIADHPELYHTDAKGKASALNEFAVIGEGRILAESCLIRRGQEDVRSLEETLYNVYEAKKYAEAVTSVGEQTIITIFSKDGQARMLSVNYKTQLAALYTKYGPKIVPNDLVLKGFRFYEEEVAAKNSNLSGGSTESAT